MAQVTVKVNGYAYTVGCEDGQELHLQAMATQVDNRVESIKGLGGNSGEVRLLLLAALLMADEIHDLRAEVEEHRAAAARPGGSADAKVESGLGQRLGKLAARAEEIAATLQRP